MNLGEEVREDKEKLREEEGLVFSKRN